VNGNKITLTQLPLNSDFAVKNKADLQKYIDKNADLVAAIVTYDDASRDVRPVRAVPADGQRRRTAGWGLETRSMQAPEGRRKAAPRLGRPRSGARTPHERKLDFSGFER
jgi:hypothetical protein